MKIYISGQISGLNENEYFLNFRNAKFKVWETMDNVFMDDIVNPLDIKPLFGIKNWWTYMFNDLKALRKCTHIAMQKNWIESKGACVEHFYAKFILKIEVIYL